MNKDVGAAVAYAVKSGRLVKSPCRDCGSLDVQAHHKDYSKPLDVIWLCGPHHREEHAKLRAANVTPLGRKSIGIIRLPTHLLDRLRKLGEAQGRSVPQQAHYILAKYLNEEAVNAQ